MTCPSVMSFYPTYQSSDGNVGSLRESGVIVSWEASISVLVMVAEEIPRERQITVIAAQMDNNFLILIPPKYYQLLV